MVRPRANMSALRRCRGGRSVTARGLGSNAKLWRGEEPGTERPTSTSRRQLRQHDGQRGGSQRGQHGHRVEQAVAASQG